MPFPDPALFPGGSLMPGGAGPIQTFLAALVGLEETIDPGNLRVYPTRPTSVETPAVYNWLLPSPSNIPATQTVEDTMNWAVRVVVSTSDIDEEATSALGYFDLVCAVLDADMIAPHRSVLNSSAYFARRTSTRTLTDTFDSIPFLAMEFMVQAEFRRCFTPT